MGHQSRPVAAPERTDDGDGLPVALRLGADGANASRSPSKLASHAGLTERLVDEDQAPLLNCPQKRAEHLSTLEILGRVALYRDEGLFFRE
jgi:hypothetical protein